MTIGKKISVASAVLVALLLTLGIVAIYTISEMNGVVHSLVGETLPRIVSIARLDSLAKEDRAIITRHIALNTAEGMNRAESDVAEVEKEFKTQLEAYAKRLASDRDRELFEKIAPAHERFLRVWARIQPLSRASKTKEALALWMEEGLPAALAVNKACQDEIEFNKENGNLNGITAVKAAGSAGFSLLVILGCAGLFGVWFAVYIVRNINHTLLAIARELGNGAEQVSTAAGQVASSGQSLAQGASEQAASLEETSASSEELSSMTRKNAENSQQAAEFMTAMSQRVAEANCSLDQMTISMRDIDASSGKISKIIKVIDEIAFQTNILALNAAVEAARAGEAGMGFAVVAEEVRNLARRSAQAAKDTTGLIGDSIATSGEGGKRLGEVVAAIHAITEGAGKVKTLVDQVDASSKEQALGIEQISKSIVQMEQVTQRTASNAEESAAASDALNDQSQTLLDVVERLHSIVGAGTFRRAAPRVDKPLLRHSSQPRRHSRRAPAPAMARNAGEFPLDDSEFKDF